MPRLKGDAGHFTGRELKVLERLGHGDRVLIADESYKTQTLKHARKIIELSKIRYAADALLYIAKLLPIENNLVVCMAPDPGDDSQVALNARRRFDAHFSTGQPVMDADGNELDLEFLHVPRLDESARLLGHRGFYTIADNPHDRLVMFRVPSDRDPYSCYTFIADDSQIGNPE